MDEHESRTPAAAPAAEVAVPYRDLAARYGPPLGVEEARGRFGELVTAAENGTVTLITRERWEMAAMVPLSQLTGAPDKLANWSLTDAKKQLGPLVRKVCALVYGQVVLTRHRKPVAAVVDAALLEDRPRFARLTDADELLRDGHTLTVVWADGGGQTDGDGEVIVEPGPEGFTASVTDHTGRQVAAGFGDSVITAVAGLARSMTLDELTAAQKRLGRPFDTEAPF